MFNMNYCKCPGCNTPALSRIVDNKIVNDTNFCYEHTTNRDQRLNEIREYVKSHDTIIDLCACGIKITEIDLSNKKFIGCNFSYSEFSNLLAENTYERMCIMDSSVYTECSFLNCDFQFCSCAGSKMVNVVFNNSKVIQTNFNGVEFYQSSLDGTDWFSSRFIKSNLLHTSVQDCNLQRTLFIDAYAENVSYKNSNTNSAIWQKNQLDGPKK